MPNGHHQPASQDGDGEEGSSMHHPLPPPDEDDGEERIPHYQSPPCDEDGEEVPLDTCMLNTEQRGHVFQDTSLPTVTDWPLDDEMVKLSIREGSGAQTGDGSKLVSHVGGDGQVRGSWADDYFKMGNFTYVVSTVSLAGGKYSISCRG